MFIVLILSQTYSMPHVKRIYNIPLLLRICIEFVDRYQCNYTTGGLCVFSMRLGTFWFLVALISMETEEISHGKGIPVMF